MLDFSQFLSGPSAALRLADLGARVIKIERPEIGDICRTLYISNLELDGDSTLFHSINRNKESVALDLKLSDDRAHINAFIRKADVMIQNFRPGVMERLGLHYEAVKELNPRMIYGEITGYGKEGPWVHKPGQDLLVQSLSGLTWLQGGAGHNEPMPFGLAIADMAAGTHLTQGILAALVHRGITGEGAHIEVSLMESLMDMQVEPFTSYLNGGTADQGWGKGAIFATEDGYLAIEIYEIEKLSESLGCSGSNALAARLSTNITRHWLSVMQELGIDCAEILNWDQLTSQEAYHLLEMEQDVYRTNGSTLRTTCCPIRIDGERYKSVKGSPVLGEDTEHVIKEILHNEPS